ncbi:m-AAA protease-interacting protein 1, mitochondrial-like [Manduca sexta]|uniref:m-AAA protease-interacting protein 1, mitochondrial n=1 Tax=Manduca sexta TaxID=7130 RepID=UPI00188FBB3B|nr:m-AAA protease-interacting protein 1, mitochondrial [Manduca sexta]XP_037303220.1 m-AAA protease-interacting protein 1, mitochondrial-like [Manduca sexta]
MNLALRQVLTRQSFRLCDRYAHKNVAKQIPLTSQCSVIQYCKYSDNPTESRRLPQLMEFPPVVWPSFIKFVKNWMFSNFIIRPYFDQEFSLGEFIEASKHAVQVVSDALQQSDFKALEGLVEKDAIAALKTAVSKLSVSQRQLLAIDKEDIFYAFPYQVGVMFDDSDKRWVEITMCYHVLRGLKHMKESGDLPPVSLGVQPEYQDNIFILNYRFIREFTKGVEDSWWVNIVNHFQPHTIVKKM